MGFCGSVLPPVLWQTCRCSVCLYQWIHVFFLPFLLFSFMALLEISKKDEGRAPSLCGIQCQMEEGGNGTVESRRGWKCFHQLYLACISSASNCKLRMGEATLKMCMNDLLIVVTEVSLSLPSVWSMPYGLNNPDWEMYTTALGMINGSQWLGLGLPSSLGSLCTQWGCRSYCGNNLLSHCFLLYNYLCSGLMPK